MVSSLACLISIGFLSRFLLRPVRPIAASVLRSFGSSTVSQHYNDHGDRRLEVDQRTNRTMCRHDGIFSDAFDLFPPTRSLSEVLNLMDQFINNQFLSALRGAGASFRLGWDAKETDDALHLWMEMPGLDKDDVEVSIVHNTLTIKGEGGKEGDDDEESVRRYSSRIDLPRKIYKFDQIKAEMKNGMLKVIVPKFKKEERNDKFHVKIE